MQKGTYTVTSDESSYSVEVKNDQICIDGKEIQFDLLKLKPDSYHLIVDGRSVEVEVTRRDAVRKSYEFLIHGVRYPVQVSSELDLRIQKMGISSKSSAINHRVTAPMPGLLIDLTVKPGDMVDEGDKLLVLEAMKMENVIKAEGSGTVEKVHAEVGKSVELGQVLISFKKE